MSVLIISRRQHYRVAKQIQRVDNSSIMPALTIYKGKLFGTLTTRPLAGDDLQIVCIVLGTYRLIQLM